MWPTSRRVIPRLWCYIDTGNIGAKSSVTPEFAPVTSPGNSEVSGCLSAVTHESHCCVTRRPLACPFSLKTGCLHVIAFRGFNLLKRRRPTWRVILTSTFHVARTTFGLKPISRKSWTICYFKAMTLSLDKISLSWSLFSLSFFPASLSLFLLFSFSL